MATRRKTTPPRIPTARQITEVQAAHPDAITLFRLGDFYEAFGGRDALLVADLTDCPVRTSRIGGLLMAGIPYHAIDRYSGILLDRGYAVAIAEEIS